jgi:ABC-2 type transport system permease protein
MNASSTIITAPSASGRTLAAAEARTRLWPPAVALARRELIRCLRQRSRVVGAFGQPLIFWILFGAGLQGSFQAPDWAAGRALSYQEYFLPGVAVLILLYTAIFSMVSIIEDRREGFLQGVLVSPASRLSIVAGKVAGGTILAVAQAALFLLLAPLLTLAGLAPPIGWTVAVGQAAAVFGCLVLLGLTLTALGYVVVWPMSSTQGFHAVMMVFLTPMWLLSGAFFPGEGSAWLSWVIRLNPLTYGVAALRRLLYLGQDLPATPSLPSLPVSLAVTTVFCAACVALAVLQTQGRSQRNIA